MRTVTLVDGVLAENGRVAVDQDDGLFLGHGAFETLRTYGGSLFGLEAHLERLIGSCAALGIRCPDEDAVVAELYAAADTVGPNAMVRIIVTEAGSRIVRAAPIPETPSPFRVATRCFVPPDWLDGTVKHVSRAFSRLAVSSAGVDEVLWTDGEGNLLEGTRSNIMAVRAGALVTPPADGRILAGVTREAMIDAALELGIDVLVEEMPVDGQYDELYVCSTLKELTGVAEMDGRPAAGCGAIGADVLKAFRANTISG